MTNVSKCLAVFAVVVSLAYVAMVSVSAVGGPNFEGQLDDPEFSDIAFEKSRDDKGVTWKAVTRLEQQKLKRAGNEYVVDPRSKFEKQTAADGEKVLPAAMIKALELTKKYQDARISVLDKQIEDFTRLVAETEKANTADRLALQTRLDGLNNELVRKNKELAAVQARIADTKLNDLKKRQEVKRRRDDIARLKNQIDILQADKVRLDEQRRKLAVLLKQLQGTVNRLNERNKQLRQQLQPDAKKSE